MVGTLRDPDNLKTSEAARKFQTSAEPPPMPSAEQEERRLPVLGVVLSFIVLFWGGLFLLWALWPR